MLRIVDRIGREAFYKLGGRCVKETFALDAAVLLLGHIITKRRHKSRYYRKERDLYPCIECQGWHLTSEETEK